MKADEIGSIAIFGCGRCGYRKEFPVDGADLMRAMVKGEMPTPPAGLLVEQETHRCPRGIWFRQHKALLMAGVAFLVGLSAAFTRNYLAAILAIWVFVSETTHFVRDEADRLRRSTS